MKTAVAVNNDALLKSVAAAEENGPLPNRSVLYSTVHAIYQSIDKNPKVTPSVIMLRITKGGINVKTPIGKRGRQKGQKIGTVKRTKRADKMDANALNILYNSVPDNCHKLVDKIKAGSIKAAIKLNCLSCVGFERMVKEDDNPASKAVDQIGQCTVMTCPMWQFRPYQKG